ncbi:MAG: hydantoinase/oxoprolinase family protein [Hyphomicrobiales bacterium]|nr:hydantoinase/oxoprolinase family protein [Hyphomicrobiales bacterium]
MGAVVGWDIGGAHVKCARIEGDAVAAVRQIPCALWLGEDRLDGAVAAMAGVAGGASLHAVTMTGELAETFPTRAHGVRAIAERMARAIAPARALIYAGRAGWLSPDEAGAMAADVASANWHASAAWAARRKPRALFIDIGSTTTDIIALADGVAARGYTDAERLTTGELVYTGVVRASLMSIAALAPFAGAMQRVAAENFSTMADVYRLTGELRPEEDQHPASDGRGKSPAECRARLARMLGRDATDASDARWDALARFFRERQIGALCEATAQVLSGVEIGANAPVIGAGAGDFVIREIAARLARPYVDFGSLVGGENARAASLCAPAVCVAMLARETAA